MNAAAEKNKCRWLLGAIVLVVVMLASLLFVPWWSKLQQYDKVQAQAVDHIVRYRRLLNSAPQLKGQLKELRRQLGERQYFMSAANPNLAAAQLQKRVKDIVAAAGGKLVSTQKVDGQSDSSVDNIEIKVRMKGDISALAGVLHELEGELPVIVVENLSVRSRRTVQGRRKDRVENYELDASFDMVGYLSGGSK